MTKVLNGHDIAERLGLIGHGSGNCRAYHCPHSNHKNGDRHPSLLIWANGNVSCKSHNCFDPKGMGYGRVYDLVMYMLGMDYKDAAAWIEGTNYLPALKPTWEHQETISSKDWYWLVRQGLKTDKKIAYDYLASRGITRETANHFGCFAWDWMPKASKVRFKDGTQPPPLESIRLAIPTLRHGYEMCKSIAFRYIPDVNEERFQFNPVLNLLAEQYQEDFGTDAATTIEELYGGRYYYLGTYNTVFNAEVVSDVVIVDGKRKLVGKKLDYVVIVEGQIDAMSLHQIGVKAIATHGRKELEVILRDVERVIFLADNDNASIQIAHHIEKLAKREFDILSCLDGLKDANSMLQSNCLIDWWEQHK